MMELLHNVANTFSIDFRPHAYYTSLLSTFLTSVWIVSVYVSTLTLNILSPLDRFTLWFFDVDKNPLRAIGTIAGALIMTGSLAWSLVRAVFLRLS
jgi:hypothetical protein